MTDFINYIDKDYKLSDTAINELNQHISYKLFDKGQEIIHAHKICSNLYYLKKGLVKGYFINEKGEEVIFRFFKEDTIFTSLDSFLNQKPTPQIIKTLEPTEVYFISKSNLDTLSEKYAAINQFFNSILTVASSNMIKRFSEVMANNATIRYNQFLEENSGLMQRISLKDLASYLGITQVSLSRIRALK